MIYQVFCDNHLLFDSRLATHQIFDAKLEFELNKTGAFSFGIYPTNPNFDKLQKLKSVITVYQDGELIFRGRPLDEEQGFYDYKQVACEGELAFLLDSIIRPFATEAKPWTGTAQAFLEKMISEHNSQQTSDDWKHFEVGNVTVSDNISTFETEYSTPWDLINKTLINTLGGYLWVSHETDGVYINYLKEEDFAEISNQRIEVGKNMLDLKRSIKGEEIVTAIIPLAGDNDNRIDIKSVNGGKDYVVDDVAVANYGFILKTVVFEQTTNPTRLMALGKNYLKNHENFYTYEWTAMDLAGIENVNPFRLGQKIEVVDDLHNVNTTIFVNKLSLDILEPTNNKLIAGASLKTFTQSVSTGQAQTAQSVAQTVVNKAMSTTVKQDDLSGYVLKEELGDYATLEEVQAARQELQAIQKDMNDVLLDVAGVKDRTTQLEAKTPQIDTNKQSIEAIQQDIAQVKNDHAKKTELDNYLLKTDYITPKITYDAGSGYLTIEI